MIEYKEIRIIDSDTSGLINNMTAFGWKLINNNTIGHTDHIVSGGGALGWEAHSDIHHSESVLTFQRETEMPHYDELNELYLQYDECINSYLPYPVKPIKKTKNVFLWIGLILSGLYALFFFVEFLILIKDKSAWLDLLGFLAFGGLSYLFIFLVIKGKRKYKIDFMNAIHTNKDNDDKIALLVKEGKKIMKTIPKEDKKTKQSSIGNDGSSYEEIKKLKELLDIGAITQEDYDQKKKELLKL